MTITWNITPQHPPAVLKNCPRCGVAREFASSGRFRINAQQKRLDVWLIYRCAHCGATWNRELFSRIHPAELDPALYARLLANDPALAFDYAVDAAALARVGTVCWGAVPYTVEGEALGLPQLLAGPVTLHLCLPCPLPLRLDRLLGERLGLPRARLARLFEAGGVNIGGNPGGSPVRFSTRLKGSATLTFDPDVVKKEVASPDEKTG